MKALQEISPDELLAKIEAGEDLHILDIREDFEVVYGMIPGAVHMPMNTVPGHLKELDPDTNYILICRSANRTHDLGTFMAQHGYTVTHMTGGMLEWPGEVIVE